MRINDAIWDELEAENRTLKTRIAELEGRLHSSADWLRAQTAEAALEERGRMLSTEYDLTHPMDVGYERWFLDLRARAEKDGGSS